MKNKIICILAFLLLSIGAGAQNFIIDPDYTFEQTKQYWDKYFAKYSQNDSKTNEVIFGEGGLFDQYKEFIACWGPRVTGNSTFTSYMKGLDNVASKIHGTTQTRANTDLWNEVGPINNPTNSDFWGQGLVNFISISKDNIKYMLAGSASGGLFYSTDQGGNWLQSGSDSKWIYSECHYATFRPGYYQTWFAINSGHGWGSPNYVRENGGIYRTTNSGTAWQQIADCDNFGTNPWNYIYRMEFDPTNTDILYVATENGLYKSSNCNATTPTWSASPVLTGAVYDLRFIPGTSKLYATKFESGTWSIVWTTNGGTSWSTLSTPFASPTEDPANGYGRITLDVKLGNADLLYFLMTTNGASSSQVWKYAISTATWTQLNPSYPLSQSHGSGWAFAAAPYSATDELYVSTDVYYAHYRNGVWSGQTGSPHDDKQHFEFIPATGYDGIVYMATDGGVYMSADYGASWTKKNKGLALCNITRFAASYTNPEMFNVASLDNSNIITTNTSYTTPYKPDWINISSGDGLSALISYKSPDTLYVSSQGGAWKRSNNRGLSFTGIGLGTSWETTGDLNKVNTKYLYRSSGSGCTNGMCLYESVSRSSDKGATNATILTNINTLVGYGTTYNVVQIYSPEYFGDYLYVHAMTGGGGNPTQHYLLRTKNANAVPATSVTWEVLNTPRGVTVWFGDIKTDQFDPDILYMCCASSGNYWDDVTTDGKEMFYKIDYNSYVPGTTPPFDDLTGNSPHISFTNKLPNCGTSSIAVEKGSDGGVYLSTDIGVYYINNKLIATGAGWRNDLALLNLPRIGSGRGGDLQINYSINKIRIGTSGRGVWEHGLYCPDLYDDTETGTYTVDKYVEVQHDITSTAVVNSGRKVWYRAGDKIFLEPGFKALSGSYFDAFIHPCDKTGNSFRSEEDETDAFTPAEENEKEIEKDVEENSFTLMPNPSNGNMTVNYDIPVNETGVLEIYSMMGKKLYSYTLSGGSSTLSISHSDLDAGIYFYKAIADGKVIASDKIVIIK